VTDPLLLGLAMKTQSTKSCCNASSSTMQ